MKQLSTLLSLLFALNGYSQNHQFHEQIFTDSVISVVLEPLEIEKQGTYYLLSRTDIWQPNRFYFQPPGPGQHPEGMNLYAYNDSVVSRLITNKEWGFFTHKALQLYPKRIKNVQPNLILVKDVKKSNADVFFSITQPVIFNRFAMIDITYYMRDKELISFEQWYRGQALLLFQKQVNNNWQLIRIVNRFVL